MAAGDVRDFVIYDEEFFGGYSEALEQNTDVFNAGSGNTIQLRPNRLIGHYEKESFFKNVAGLVSRRDIESTAGATDGKLEQGEFAGVKVNRKIGPVKNTIDSFRKIGEDAGTMSFMLGQQIGAAAAVDMVNTAILALNAAINEFGAGVGTFDGTAGTPTHKNLAQILRLMGDKQQDVVAWVMHSNSWFDLLESGLDQSGNTVIQELAGVTVFSGGTASLGRPVVVTDSDSLIASGTPDNYQILGLTEGACVIDESEEREIVSDLITGEENLGMRIQGEYAYNLRMKGFAWDFATASSPNPDDTALATAGNWDYKLSTSANGIKGGPGARGTFL